MTVAGRILSFGLSFRGQPVTTAARDPHQPCPDTVETVTDRESSRMKLALGPYIRFSRILLFPLAMVIYDFSAYLTTDLIQPGIIHIIREFEADVALAPASVSLYLAGGWHYSGCWGRSPTALVAAPYY